jgi:phage terminase large subunit-like protein
LAGYGKITSRTDFNSFCELSTDTNNISYLTKVMRRQCKVEDFIDDVANYMKGKIGQIILFGAGQEQEIIRLYQSKIKQLVFMRSTQNKVISSTHVRQAWNLGNLLVNENVCNITEQFINEILAFNGDPRNHDDAIDAIRNAYYNVKNRNLQLAISTLSNNNQYRDPFMTKQYNKVQQRGSQRTIT